MDGTFVEEFTISGVSGVRDMAYNPNTGYFYGAAANTSLFEMDFTNKTLVSTITAATDCRAIAYDDDDNTFWANNWSTDLTEFDMTGAATGKTMSSVPSIYGAAYDKWSDSANPTMWLFQGTGSDVATQLVEFAMDETATGRVVDVSAFPGFTEAVGSGSGGLATYVDNGVAYFLVNVQQNPDKVYKVYLAKLPSTETDITAFSFAEQTGAATIDATAHTVNIEVVNGTNVTALVSTFTLSDGATANIGGTAQVSGTTANDFSSAVTYNVVAQDGTTNQDWTVTVTVAAPVTAPITFTVTNDNPMYTGFALKGSWDVDGNYDATWNGGAEHTPFYNDGTHGDVTASDNIWTVIVNLVPDAGANTWEWGVNDQAGNWLDGNFQFTVNDATPQTLNYNAPVSVNTISNTVNIYPNPSNGAFYVTVDGVYNVEVVDITGKVINTQTVENNATVNIQKSGIYFLRFSNEKANFVEKVIVK